MKYFVITLGLLLFGVTINSGHSLSKIKEIPKAPVLPELNYDKLPDSVRKLFSPEGPSNQNSVAEESSVSKLNYNATDKPSEVPSEPQEGSPEGPQEGSPEGPQEGSPEGPQEVSPEGPQEGSLDLNNDSLSDDDQMLISTERPKIPIGPVLPELNYDSLPDSVKKLLSSELATLGPLQPETINSDLDDVSNINSDKVVERQVENSRSRTYGISFTDGRGFVWNNLVQPKVTYTIGDFESRNIKDGDDHKALNRKGRSTELLYVDETGDWYFMPDNNTDSEMQILDTDDDDEELLDSVIVVDEDNLFDETTDKEPRTSKNHNMDYITRTVKNILSSLPNDEKDEPETAEKDTKSNNKNKGTDKKNQSTSVDKEDLKRQIKEEVEKQVKEYFKNRSRTETNTDTATSNKTSDNKYIAEQFMEAILSLIPNINKLINLNAKETNPTAVGNNSTNNDTVPRTAPSVSAISPETDAVTTSNENTVGAVDKTPSQNSTATDTTS